MKSKAEVEDRPSGVWHTGTPKPSKEGVKCDGYLVVLKYKWSGVAPSLLCHHHGEGWLDHDFNKMQVKCWMIIPEVPDEG